MRTRRRRLPGSEGVAFGELRSEGWEGGGNDKVLLKKKKSSGVSCARAMARAGM